MARNNDAAVGDYSFLNDINFMEEFSKVVSVVKKSNTKSACFGPNFSNEYRWLDGGGVGGLGYDNNSYCCITSDGMLYAVQWNPSAASSHGISEEDAANTIAWIAVDVNGNKNPNVWGRDLFLFDLTTTKGIIPSGAFSTGSCNKNSTGYSCTAKVLRENAINY